jgi:hypothetical protein
MSPIESALMRLNRLGCGDGAGEEGRAVLKT